MHGLNRALVGHKRAEQEVVNLTLVPMLRVFKKEERALFVTVRPACGLNDHIERA